MRKLLDIARRPVPSPPLSAGAGASTRAGFTLVEIMFVFVLVAAVYAVAMPSLGRTRVSASVHNASRTVVSSVQLSRATAIRYGRPVLLRVDAAGDRLWVEVDTSVAGTGVVDTMGFTNLADEYDVDLYSNRAGLCFNGRGIATTGTACPNLGALIAVSLQDQADTIVISTVGRVLQ